jgi:hypothetical protein
MTVMVPCDAFFFLAHLNSIIPTNDGVIGSDVKGSNDSIYMRQRKYGPPPRMSL